MTFRSRLPQPPRDAKTADYAKHTKPVAKFASLDCPVCVMGRALLGGRWLRCRPLAEDGVIASLSLRPMACSVRMTQGAAAGARKPFVDFPHLTGCHLSSAPELSGLARAAIRSSRLAAELTSCDCILMDRPGSDGGICMGGSGERCSQLVFPTAAFLGCFWVAPGGLGGGPD